MAAEPTDLPASGPGPTQGEHPLAATLGRLPGLYEHARVAFGAPADPAWVPVARLPADPALIDRQIAAIRSHYETDRTDVPARLFALGYPYQVVFGALGAVVLDRRLPDLDRDRVLVAFGEDGFVERVAFASDRFWCLPGDPAARHPGATVVPDLETLRDGFRLALTDHLEPVFAAIDARVRVGAAAMWLATAERCVRVVTTLLPRLGRVDACAAEVAAILGGTGSRLAMKRAPELIAAAGRSGPAVIPLVQTCCHYYKLDANEYCKNCPHRPREERIAAMREWAAEHA
jgi:ferric iron reductase protein FhuF